jgi:hypothetical protein
LRVKLCRIRALDRSHAAPLDADIPWPRKGTIRLIRLAGRAKSSDLVDNMVLTTSGSAVRITTDVSITALPD